MMFKKRERVSYAMVLGFSKALHECARDPTQYI